MLALVTVNPIRVRSSECREQLLSTDNTKKTLAKSVSMPFESLKINNGQKSVCRGGTYESSGIIKPEPNALKKRKERKKKGVVEM